MQTIGSKLKEFRAARRLTLQQVAEAAGCTAAYVSQVERNKTSPSIASLKRIAAALNVRIVDFFLDEVAEDPVVLDPSDWPRMSMPRWKATIRQMVRSVRQRQMQPFYTVIDPGGGAPEEYSHQGEEFGLVLEGELTLRVGADTLLVREGSSFYYSSSLPHAWTNEGGHPCRVIWVVAPPSW